MATPSDLAELAFAAVEFPDEIDADTQTQAETAADRDLAEANACRRCAHKLIRDAGALLYRAAETGNHLLAVDWTSEAADCLHAAGRLIDGERRFDLLRLSAQLRGAARNAFGHPSGQILDEVADEADDIAQALDKGEGEP